VFEGPMSPDADALCPCAVEAFPLELIAHASACAIFRDSLSPRSLESAVTLRVLTQAWSYCSRSGSNVVAVLARQTAYRTYMVAL